MNQKQLSRTEFQAAFSNEQIDQYLIEFLYSIIGSKEFIQKTEEDRVDIIFFLMQIGPLIKEKPLMVA